MLRYKRRHIIAILSVIILTAGVAISAYAQVKFSNEKTLVNNQFSTVEELSWISDVPISSAILKPIKIGSLIGIINIPRIKKTFKIYEGTNSDELAKGVGHYVNSVMPGIKDNSVLAGHRDTVFANLGSVHLGDLIKIKLASGFFVYKVSKIRIVDKDDRTIIVPTKMATLTISTCYPFIYIGSAPKRYIVTAHLLPPNI